MSDDGIETAKKAIQELVDAFSAHQAEYESSGYLESQLRTDFLNGLFEALGWDVSNKKKLSPLEREIIEEAVK